MPGLDQQILLTDGRKLGFDDRGPLDGTPLFYFHGSPSSRLESRLFLGDALLDDLGIRLLSPDRPGMGLSDFQPGRRLLHWLRDVLTLAGRLGLARFSILAYSLGGPYGAACAYALPERLGRVGIVSGEALFTMPALVQDINGGTRKFLTLPRDRPLASRLFLWLLGMTVRYAPGRFVAQAESLLPPPDSQIVRSDIDFRRGFIALAREALRQGTLGAHHEALLGITDWDFRLEEITAPVRIWHGEADRNVPVDMARYMAAHIPRCEAEIYLGEGHLSAFKKHAAEIARALTG